MQEKDPPEPVAAMTVSASYRALPTAAESLAHIFQPSALSPRRHWRSFASFFDEAQPRGILVGPVSAGDIIFASYFLRPLNTLELGADDLFSNPQCFGL